MSVIIRLQNLPWTANALDIRRFFNGLTIPDGGVHIIGGEKGDAFIAFGGDEDARKAMLLDHNKINGTILKLYLSSKTEMQNVIAIARGAPPSEARVAVQSAPASTPFISQSPQSESYQTRQVNRQTPTSVYPNQPNFNAAVPQVSRPYVPMSHALQRNTYVPSSSGVSAPSTLYAPNITVTAQSHSAPNGNTYANATNQQGWNRPQHDGRYPDNTLNYRSNTETSSVPYNSTPQAVDKTNEKEEDPAEAFIRANQNREFARREVRKHSDGRPPSPPVPHPEEKGYPEYGANRKRERSPLDNRSNRSKDSGDNSYSRDQDKRNFSRYSPKRYNRRVDSKVHDQDSRTRRVEREQEEEGSENVYVYLENMPINQVSYSAVRRLFSGCLIPSSGMKLINNKFGERNGCAYIKFKSEIDCQDALKLDGSYFGNRKIYVKMCLPKNFDDAVDSFTPNAQGGQMVSRQEPMDIPPRSIGAQHKGELHRGRSPSPPLYQCVMLRNLPRNTEREDIFRFFQGLKIGGYGCYIEYDIHGNALGDGYVEFVKQEDYQQALLYHKKKLNHRCIDIYPMLLRDIKEKTEKHKDFIRKEKERSFKGFKKEGFPPYSSNRNFSEDNTRQERDFSRDREKERGQGDYYKDRNRNSRTFGNDRASGQNRGKNMEPNRRSRSQSSPRSRQKSPRKWEPPVSESQLIGNDNYKHIKMSGIPFDCDESVIQSFFSGLNITSVKIIYDSIDHSAHSDGYVAFLTPEDCQKAKTYSMRYIGKRYIQIFPMDYETWRNEIDELVNCNAKYLGTYPALKPTAIPQRFAGKGHIKFDAGRGPPFQLMIKNIPKNSAFRDLLELFKNYNPLQDKGNFNPEKAEGRLFFQEGQDAMDALKDMNHRYVKGVPLVVFQPRIKTE